MGGRFCTQITYVTKFTIDTRLYKYETKMNILFPPPSHSLIPFWLLFIMSRKEFHFRAKQPTPRSKTWDKETRGSDITSIAGIGVVVLLLQLSVFVFWALKSDVRELSKLNSLDMSSK
jgi:hypothetical protein